MTFCIAPFVNVHVTPVGISKPCCLYKGLDTVASPLDAFYSKEWDELRKRMLSDEILPECDSCNNGEHSVGFFRGLETVHSKQSIKHQTYRDWFNEKYKFDGTWEIKSLDVSRSNKCNFKCIICGWDRSSRWYQDEQALSKILPRLDVPIASNARIMPVSVTEKEVSIDIDEVDFSKVDSITIYGGEPLVDDKITEILHKMKPGGFILLSTNCSVSPYKLPLQKFKRVIINISIDGLNGVGEDVRLGLNTKHFIKTLKKWNDIALNHDDFSFIGHYVYHNLNAYSYQETKDVLSELVKMNWMFDILKYPRYLSPRILPEYIHIPETIRKRKYDENECINFIKFVDYMKTKQTFHPETLKIYDLLKSKIKV